MPDFRLEESEPISLCEALDRILNKGAVVVGELTISVANIDLLYLGLQVILTSIETARQILPNTEWENFPAPRNAGPERAQRGWDRR